MPKRKAAPEQAVGSSDCAEAAAATLVCELQALGASFSSGVAARLAPDGLGLGLFATRDLRAGDELAVIPGKAALTAASAVASLVGDAVRAAGVTLGDGEHCVSERSVLLLYLLAARQGTCAAPAAHVAYSRSLPRDIGIPLLWPEDQQSALLGGTELLRYIQLQLVALKQQHGLLFPSLSCARADLFPSECFSLTDFMWAHAVVASRAFPASSLHRCAGLAPEQAAEAAADEAADGVLLPWLDIANHDGRGADVSWQPSLSPALDGFRVVLLRGVASGEQIMSCYGAKSAGRMLLGYGFCSWDAPPEQLPLRVGAVFAEVTPTARARKMELFRAVAGGGLSLEVVLSADDSALPAPLLAAARVCCLSATEAALAAAPDCPQLEQRARAFIAEMLQRRRAQLLRGSSDAAWHAELAAARSTDCVRVRASVFAVTPAGALLMITGLIT